MEIATPITLSLSGNEIGENGESTGEDRPVARSRPIHADVPAESLLFPHSSIPSETPSTLRADRERPAARGFK